MAIVGALGLIREWRGNPTCAVNGGQVPKWVHAYGVALGAFGVLAAVPVLFTDNPYWLTDKIFYGVDLVLSIFR